MPACPCCANLTHFDEKELGYPIGLGNASDRAARNLHLTFRWPCSVVGGQVHVVAQSASAEVAPKLHPDEHHAHGGTKSVVAGKRGFTPREQPDYRSPPSRTCMYLLHTRAWGLSLPHPQGRKERHEFKKNFYAIVVCYYLWDVLRRRCTIGLCRGCELY